MHITSACRQECTYGVYRRTYGVYTACIRRAYGGHRLCIRRARRAHGAHTAGNAWHMASTPIAQGANITRAHVAYAHGELAPAPRCHRRRQEAARAQGSESGTWRDKNVNGRGARHRARRGRAFAWHHMRRARSPRASRAPRLPQSRRRQ
jgi:hypothetical protein